MVAAEVEEILEGFDELVGGAAFGDGAEVEGGGVIDGLGADEARVGIGGVDGEEVGGAPGDHAAVLAGEEEAGGLEVVPVGGEGGVDEAVADAGGDFGVLDAFGASVGGGIREAAFEGSAEVADGGEEDGFARVAFEQIDGRLGGDSGKIHPRFGGGGAVDGGGLIEEGRDVGGIGHGSL